VVSLPLSHHSSSSSPNKPDQDEIRKLQYKYGYYLDKCLYKEVFESPPDPIVLNDSN